MKKQTRGKPASLANTKKKLLLRNTFDPDTGNYFPAAAAPKPTSSSSRTEIKKRTREVTTETETESVTVSKPIKEVCLLSFFFF